MRFKIFGLFLIGSLAGINYSQAQLLRNILGTSNNGPIPSNEVMAEALKADVLELVQSKYDGRKLGTYGYKNVSAHLERRMQQLGLTRYGSVGYRGVYKFPVGRQRTVDSKFYVEGRSLLVGTEVLPLGFCATEDNDSYILPYENSNYAPWNMALPKTINNESDIASSLKPLIVNAQSRGATALYFFDNVGNIDLKKLDERLSSKVDPDIKIPVWIISKKAWNENFKDVYSLINVRTMPRYKTTFDEGYNIVGLMDNKAEKTIVLMADYDQIVPDESTAGAYLNASGVSVLLQMAQILKDNSFKNYNYAFALFSGSERSGIGVKSFLSIPEIKSHIAYAIDMTALGKANGQNLVYVNGISSSNKFAANIKAAAENFEPRVGDTYPFGASYTEFLESDLPTMSFSTGFQKFDPKVDNINNINFAYLADNVRFIIGIITEINKGEKAPIFARHPLVVRNEDLAFPKKVVAIATNDRNSVKEKPQKSNAEKLAEAKANLKNQHGKSKINTNIQAPPLAKLPVEESYNGDANIVIDAIGLGVNELDDREGGAIIQSVLADSKAASVGLQAGDIVLQIGSMPVFNAKNYLLTSKKYKEGERAYYKVKKADGNTVLVNVQF